MATQKRKTNPDKARARLKLRAAIMDVKDKRLELVDKEQALRQQLRSLQ